MSLKSFDYEVGVWEWNVRKIWVTTDSTRRREGSVLIMALIASSFFACGRSEQTTPTAATSSPTRSELEAPSLPTSPSSADPKSETTPAWGGLTVHESGVPLARARRALLLLHGYGADADDLRQVAELLLDQKETAIILPQAPLALERGGFAWFQMNGVGFDPAITTLQQFLTYFQEQHPRLPFVLGGFSQGAILSANLLSSAGPNLRAVLLFSGANILPYPPPEAASAVPVFISHGREDRVLTFEQGQQLARSFERWNYQVTWTPFAGGHTISKQVILASKDFLNRVFKEKSSK